MRTAAPVALRRVTRCDEVVMTFAGRFNASETRATMIGVTAVASTDPRCQKSGTITAAAAAEALEIRSVATEIELRLGSFSGGTPPTLALHP